MNKNNNHATFRGFGGFTLVELLVLLALAVFVVAMALPAAKMTQSVARTEGCQSNLKQIMALANMYAADHNDYCIDYGTAKDLGVHVAAGTRYTQWLDQLWIYAGADDVSFLECPLQTVKRPAGVWYFDGQSNHERTYWPGYGLNMWVHMLKHATSSPPASLPDKLIKLSECLHPANKVYAADSGMYVNYGNRYNFPDQDVYGGKFSAWGDANSKDSPEPSDRHSRGPTAVTAGGQAGRVNSNSGGPNIGFFDGHVAFMKFDDLVPYYTNSSQLSRYWLPLESGTYPLLK